MKYHQTPLEHGIHSFYASPDQAFSRMQVRRMVSVLLILFAVFGLAAPSVLAQNRQVRAQPARLTVQAGVSGTITTKIYVITTNTSIPINLSVEQPLPAGVTGATLDTASFLNPGGFATLTVNYNGAVPQTGLSEIGINATGDYTYRLPVPIHSAVLWGGNTNSYAWSDAGNWGGGALPSASDVVVFPNAGANDQGTNPYTMYTNVLVSTSHEIGGMRFSHGDNTNDQSYSFVIEPNATISVIGSNGFSFLQDSIDLVGDMDVNFYGGGSLVVSNANAFVALLKGYQQNSTLNLGGLGNFVANVNRLGLGDYTLYPYYTNNGYSVQGGSGTNSRPSRFVPQVSLARTNYLRAFYVDADNYTNSESRIYGLTLSKTETQATSSSIQCSFLFGETNIFLMDGVVFGASGAKASSDTQIRFNPDTNVIPAGVMPVAFFRGTNGTSRLSVFAVADATGPGGSGSGTKANVNLNGGYVDAMVDRLYLGRDRQESQDNDTAEATLSIAHGVFNANTAYVSCQELGNNTIPTDEQGSDPSGEVYGTLNVSTNAVFVVNGTLYVGYTTADPGDKRVAEDGNGQINISNGGILMADSIQVGGITKVSGNNRISVTDGGTLIVTNQIGETDKYLNTLTMRDSTLVLNVDGSQSTPYVYATNLVTGGLGNILELASVTNVDSYPTQLPLVQYKSASPNFSVDLPDGLYGYIVNNTANSTIDVVLLNSAPADRVWNGSPSTAWNTSSPNWMGGQVFVNGDSAQFDDTASSANVNVSETVYVGGGGVLITNNAKSYIFDGSGQIGGTAPMNKWGTNELTMNTVSQLPLTVHQGSVNGSGSLGATVLETNTSLTYAGTINRLTSSGAVSLLSGAVVGNGADIKAGTVTNSGTINNAVTIASNCTMTVESGGLINGLLPNNSSVDAGGSLVLDGTWQSGQVNGPSGTYRLDIFGTMTGIGKLLAGKQDLTTTPPAELSRLNIGSGGVLSPGDAPGQITYMTLQGRFDFVSGSKIIMDVDMDSADGSNPYGSSLNGSANAKNSDVLLVDRWSTMLGTLEITNIGTQPFQVGTVLKLFKRQYDEYGPSFGNKPLNDGQLPVMDPPSPGLGMLWNLANFRTNGVITIVGTATNPPVLGTQVFQGTNITFSWPADHTGWQLETQVNPLNIGLSNNWSVVQGSGATNSYTITNWVNNQKDGTRFYRLAHPSYQYQ